MRYNCSVRNEFGSTGDAYYKLMTLDADKFIRRFLIHMLPDGFHRSRHYGLFANANRVGNIALARRLLGVPGQPRQASPTMALKSSPRRRLERLSLLPGPHDHHRDL
jgi:hypothetical protein